MATPETENGKAMEVWKRPNHEFYYPTKDASIPGSRVGKVTHRVWDEAAFKKHLARLVAEANKKKKGKPGSFPLRNSLSERTGAPQTILTNHFELKTDQTEFYEYEILDLDQNGATRKKMQALFRKAVATWTFLKDDQDSFATDGQKTIVSWKNLHDNVDISKSWGIDVGRNTSLKARFSFVGKVGINDLLQQSRCDFEQEKIDLASVERCLNIIIAKSFDENVVRLSGKKFYVRKARTDLDSSKSLELMRGYHYTVKPGMGNLLMNFNVATSAFFCPVLVSEFLAETATFGNATERTSLLRQLRVYIEYPHKEERLNRPGARIKKICAVGPSLIKDLNFRKKVKDNERRPILDATGNWQLETNATTVVDHLEAAYHMPGPVRKDQKAINVGSATDPVYYAAEMLRILPFQLYSRPVPDHLTKFMVEEAARSPAESQRLIENEGLSHLGFADVKDEAVRFRNGVPLSLYPTMMQVPSARLPYPSVQYQWNDFRDKARSREIQPQAFTQSGWNIPDDQAFHDPKVLTLRYFLIQTSYGPIKGSDLQDFENQLKEQLSRRCKVDKRNVVPANPGPDTINFGETGALEASLSKAQHSNSNLVILLIPQIDRWIYAEFKNLADRKYGLRSLCLAKPSQFKDKKYMTNICQKINVKFGGNNASVSGVESKLGNNTLVLGADLVHPGPGALEESPSIACIVGSVDNRGSRFLGSARLQSKMKEDREIIDRANVRDMVKERIIAWRETSSLRQVPENIIYYRDGVSEGHYSRVVSEELKAIISAWDDVRKASNQLMGPRTPKITALVGVKRHHTRFYPLNQDDMDPRGNLNCLPGTWVDTVVASPYYQDFYLQSHSGIKGTARPTHYFILRNDGILNCKDINQLRELTHHLCYTYCRATGGISYAAPTYYADHLCDRARLYLPNTWSGNVGAFRDELDSRKNAHRDSRRQARDDLYRAGQPWDASMGLKTDAELAEEAKDEESVRLFARAKVLQYAKDEFYLGGKEKNGNPWHENLNKVMFWM